jgi:hypothetical protein
MNAMAIAYTDKPPFLSPCLCLMEVQRQDCWLQQPVTIMSYHMKSSNYDIWLSLGTGEIRPLFHLSSPGTLQNIYIFYFIYFLSPSSVDCTYPINKIIKLAKKSH